MITDCHVHIEPYELFKPAALELMKKKRHNFEEIESYSRSPAAFLGPVNRFPSGSIAMVQMLRIIPAWPRISWTGTFLPKRIISFAS